MFVVCLTVECNRQAVFGHLYSNDYGSTCSASAVFPCLTCTYLTKLSILLSPLSLPWLSALVACPSRTLHLYPAFYLVTSSFLWLSVTPVLLFHHPSCILLLSVSFAVGILSSPKFQNSYTSSLVLFILQLPGVSFMQLRWTPSLSFCPCLVFFTLVLHIEARIPLQYSGWAAWVSSAYIDT